MENSEGFIKKSKDTLRKIEDLFLDRIDTYHQGTQRYFMKTVLNNQIFIIKKLDEFKKNKKG